MKIFHRKSLILIALWALFFRLSVGFVRSQCLQDQQSLLIQFKENLTFDSTLSTKLVSWNSSTDCCSWFGVTCSSGGHVIGLDLSNEFISGGIDNSSRLFNLHHLQSLDLALNQFNGSLIPSAMGKLAHLSHLDLFHAGFSGQVPAEISGLTSLISLNLSTSDQWEVWLKLENPNLSMLLRNLTRLTELDLSGIDLSAEGGGWCRALSTLTGLRVLNLGFCDLSGSIDSSLVQLKSLSIVTLFGNSNISGPIPEYFGNFLNLTSLNLSLCSLHGKLPEMIFHLPHLQMLDLSNNAGLQGPMPEFPENESLQTLWLRSTSFGGNLPESIGNLRRLSNIDISGCKFSGPIPDTMANLTHLVYLDFSYNKFSGPIITTNWSGLSKLEYINLRNNSLHGAIPASMFVIPSLRQMFLGLNQFTGILNEPSKLASSILESLGLAYNEFAGPFPMFLSQLRSLKLLQLRFNNFSGAVNLSSFQNLSYLDLSYNSLSINETGVDSASFPQFTFLRLASCNLTRFPSFLKVQSDLQQLDLSNNKIGGDIPDWIWTLPYLAVLNLSYNCLLNFQAPPKGFNSYLVSLDLSNNKLQGELLTKIPYPKYLFFLSNNNIQGSIPRAICNATFLAVLDFSSNSLNGTIPQCLFEMEFLSVLNLGGNNLSGNIPDTFLRNCDRLQTLDLNGNQLEGKIPRLLANCKSLAILNFGNNQINDVFPCHLNNISSLRVLVLRSNNFHGPIGCPINKSSWTTLQIVDLASNNFRGEIPSQFLRTWKAMIIGKDELQSIGFNIDGPGTYYRLSGMPYNNALYYYEDAMTVTMKGIEVKMVKILTVFTFIDFSCNKLEGRIPEVIGEFKALHILNMSHNSLIGQIPKSFGNLLQLESMDLSSNHLAGKIPQELADLNFLAVLNLSNNQLIGRIPTSNQFQTFPNASFQGNDGLCGFPLTKSCVDEKKSCDVHSEESCRVDHSDDGSHIDWNFLSVELGLIFGLGIVILPLMFWRRWRIWYYTHVDILLSRLLPRLNQRSRNRGSRRTATKTKLREGNKMAGEVALQPRVSKVRRGRRTDGVIVV